MSEQLSWIEAAISLQYAEEAIELVDALCARVGVNLVAECTFALNKAQVYRDKNEPIPPGLVSAIQNLYTRPSGYTGLSVWEAYSYYLRSKQA